MAAKPDPIQVSEIGNYLYCRRSWWYQQQGFASQNIEALAKGSAAHSAHGRTLRRSQQLRWLAFALFTISLLFLALQFLS